MQSCTRSLISFHRWLLIDCSIRGGCKLFSRKIPCQFFSINELVFGPCDDVFIGSGHARAVGRRRGGGALSCDGAAAAESAFQMLTIQIQAAWVSAVGSHATLLRPFPRSRVLHRHLRLPTLLLSDTFAISSPPRGVCVSASSAASVQTSAFHTAAASAAAAAWAWSNRPSARRGSPPPPPPRRRSYPRKRRSYFLI